MQFFAPIKIEHDNLVMSWQLYVNMKLLKNWHGMCVYN